MRKTSPGFTEKVAVLVHPERAAGLGEHADDLGAGAPGQMEARDGVAVAERVGAAALGPPHQREDLQAPGTQPAALLPRREVDVGLVDQPLGDDHVRQRVDQGDVGARAQLQVMRRLDMRGADEVDPARVGDDQPGALAQPLLHARGEHRVAVGRVGADDQDDVGMLDRVEILRAGGGAIRGLQAVAGRRVADAGAGVDIVGAQSGSHQFLHQERFLVGAADDRHTPRGVEVGDRIVIANTKGFTGHAMGAGIEDVVAIKALETGLVPLVPNYREADPDLGTLNLSRGGSYPVRYALRLAAGFGSQVAMALLRWTPVPDGQRRAPDQLGYAYRIVDADDVIGVVNVFGPCASGSLQAHVEPGTFVVPDQLVDRTWGRPDTFTIATGGILVTSTVAGTIDFDNAGPGDPSREIAMVIFEFGGKRQLVIWHTHAVVGLEPALA